MTITQNELPEALFAGIKCFGTPLEIESIYPLYETLLDVFMIEGIQVDAPQLVIYSSYKKEVVTRHLMNKSNQIDQSYLMFDTHLLDVFGEFTECFLSTHHPEFQVQKLFYRLLAENMYVHGRLHEALHYSYMYRTAKSQVVFSEERTKSMARHLLVQEAFTLCHELSHWFLFRSNAAERSRQIEYKRDLWTKYFDDLIEKRIHTGDAKGMILLKEMQQYIQTDDLIVEEVACDTFASICLTEYFNNMNGYSKSDIAVSAFLGIQNLQMLSFLKRDVGATKKNGAAWLTFNMTLRMKLYKHHLSVYFNNYDKEFVRVFNDEIVNAKEQYDDRVLSPFIDAMNQVQCELMLLNKLPKITILDDMYDMMNQLVRALLEQEESAK